jgi:hypothetical protein
LFRAENQHDARANKSELFAAHAWSQKFNPCLNPSTNTVIANRAEEASFSNATVLNAPVFKHPYRNKRASSRLTAIPFKK